MDTVPEDSIVQANSVELDASSLATQSSASNAPKGPSKVSRASIERPAAIRSTTQDDHPSSPTRRVSDSETIQKVEAVVDKIMESLQNQNESISITLKSKGRSGTATSPSSQVQPSRTQYKLSFPGNTPQEAWRFSTAELAKTVRRRTAAMLTCHPAVVLRILELIHEALFNNVVVSKRNIYYQDPELFKSQKVVDRYVDILSYTFGIQRQALNVVSPPAESHASNAGKGIILTAKGYPDISTRGFLRLLSISSHPPPPIVALVDFDPDGIVIMSTYKHGSAALAHESDNLRVPLVRWLGVKSVDLTTTKPNTESYDDRNGLLQLSMRDRKKAVKMLDQELCAEDGVEQEWRRELQVMLMLNMKGEMEMLSQLKGGIELWVEDRICAETLRSRKVGNDSLPSPRDDS
ncbi:MAG: hypothetical protein Q9228_005920 [Teloschistes exilis]